MAVDGEGAAAGAAVGVLGADGVGVAAVDQGELGEAMPAPKVQEFQTGLTRCKD